MYYKKTDNQHKKVPFIIKMATESDFFTQKPIISLSFF